MKEIEISQGYITIVDDEDYELINRHKWKILRSRKRVYAAREVGKTKVRGKWETMLLHRFLTKAKKGEYVDHINGNTLDNRKENLRIASNSQNLGNRGKQKDNTSGYKGVVKFSGKGGYAVGLTRDFKRYVFFSISTTKFEASGMSLEDLAKIYDRAAVHFYGEFANINFPELRDQYVEDNKNIYYSTYSVHLTPHYKKWGKNKYEGEIINGKVVPHYE